VCESSERKILSSGRFYHCYKKEEKLTKKKKSSETWRAILWGREALKKGLIKRIGPGDSVNI
jgi:hypothetical protein